MDLADYLETSRLQRKEIIKISESIINRAINTSRTIKSDTFFPGPCLKGFQLYKENLDEEIKKDFHSKQGSKKQIKNSFTINKSNKTSIERVYSGNHQFLDKKQKVILPKDRERFSSEIKLRLMSDKNSSFAINLFRKPSEKYYARFQKQSNEEAKNMLFLPVLSTAGTHQERSKQYKYK